MKNWLQSELFLKIISVIIAIFLWYSVNKLPSVFPENNKLTRVQEVMIEAKYDASRYTIVEMPRKAEISLKGDPSLVEELHQFHVYADLRNLGEGIHYNVPLQVEGIPPQVEVKIRPSKIYVVIETKDKKAMLHLASRDP
jgi:YbbR domain-containing protein